MVHLVKLGDGVYCLGGEDRKKSRTAAAFHIPVSMLIEEEGPRTKVKDQGKHQ
jgi:hypothetical protein